MTKPTTIIRAVRDGQVCQLVQQRSRTGIPKCCNCLRAIPRSYRESWKGRPGWFCTDKCAIEWANDVAGQVRTKPAPTGRAGMSTAARNTDEEGGR